MHWDKMQTLTVVTNSIWLKAICRVTFSFKLRALFTNQAKMYKIKTEIKLRASLWNRDLSYMYHIRFIVNSFTWWIFIPYTTRDAGHYVFYICLERTKAEDLELYFLIWSTLVRPYLHTIRILFSKNLIDFDFIDRLALDLVFSDTSSLLMGDARRYSYFIQGECE